MPFNDALRLQVMSILTSRVAKIANEAKNNASWSQDIPSAISSTSTTMPSADTYRCTIVVDGKEGSGAPQAAAYEFGSGEHRTRISVRGEGPGLYPIEAVNVPLLKFWWKKRNVLFVGPWLPYGHPGVAPRPFLQPAIDKNLDDLKSNLAGAFKNAWLVTNPKVIVIHGNKPV